MPRYRITVEYDGTGLAGWQIQRSGIATVQSALQEAIFRFSGERVKVFCAGRTDAGVHARGQVAHFDLSSEHRGHTVLRAVNFHLIGWRISVVAAERTRDDFHARFDALGRHYRYTILNRPAKPALDRGQAWHIPQPLDVPAMHEAAQSLLGHRDFSSFRDSQCQAKSPMKTLERFDVSRQAGERIVIEASARSFLHHQVRNMVGSLMLVGKGRWNLDDFRSARDACDRRAGGPMAPAEGLCLMAIDYFADEGSARQN